MPYTLAHMKLSRNLLVEIVMMVITLSPPVFKAPQPLLCFRGDFADNDLALSGACATISSDALMNPFDGTATFDLHRVKSNPLG